MGVMACERTGCHRIGCDRLINILDLDVQQYICDYCYNELSDVMKYLKPPMMADQVAEAIMKFMGEPADKRRELTTSPEIMDEFERLTKRSE